MKFFKFRSILNLSLSLLVVQLAFSCSKELLPNQTEDMPLTQSRNGGNRSFTFACVKNCPPDASGNTPPCTIKLDGATTQNIECNCSTCAIETQFIGSLGAPDTLRFGLQIGKLNAYIMSHFSTMNFSVRKMKIETGDNSQQIITYTCTIPESNITGEIDIAISSFYNNDGGVETWTGSCNTDCEGCKVKAAITATGPEYSCSCSPCTLTLTKTIEK